MDVTKDNYSLRGTTFWMNKISWWHVVICKLYIRSKESNLFLKCIFSPTRDLFMAKKELKNNQTLSNIDYMINLFGHFQTILLFTHGHLATHVLSITLPHGHSFMSGTNAFEALLVRVHLFSQNVLPVCLIASNVYDGWTSVFRFVTEYSQFSWKM